MSTKTLVFIHGLFMNPRAWDSWRVFFQSAGYTCHAPAYPFHEGIPSDLRKNPDPSLGKVTFEQVQEVFQNFIDQLPEKPILIGHSMGGLLVQKLISSGRGLAGVCINSAPPKGIFVPSWSFLRINLPVINPLRGNSLFVPSVQWFHYAFCNTATSEQARIEYEKYVVPESRNIPRQSIENTGRINFRQPHKPLLFIAGEKDTIIPAALNKKNFQTYSDKESISHFKEFPGRTHHICAQDDWEEVASFIREWIEKYVE